MWSETAPEADAAELVEQITALYEQRGMGEALLSAFRRALLVLPLADGHRALIGESGGLPWVYAFSSTAQLARFASVRHDGTRQWEYVTITGRRLLDAFLPALGRPVGVAMDVAGERPMLFPPVSGFVPAAVAVDVSDDERERV